MAHDPQGRFERARALDPRIDSPGREGLTGSARAELYEETREPQDVTLPPDERPEREQPQWRKDFPVDWPADQFVARRDFAKFLVLTSGAFVAGQGWIAAQHLLRKNRPTAQPAFVGRVSELAVGTARMFKYPSDHDPCLLVRVDESTIVAYSQACTHLSCAVVPRVADGVLHCPCHEGYFDLRTGRNIAGPPPRPLPKIVLEIRGDEIWAVGVDERTV